MDRLGELRPLAVLVSWVVDIVGANVFGLLLVLAALVTRELALADLQSRAVMTWYFTKPDILVLTSTGGFAFSVLAGYIAARIAGRAELLHGLASSVGGLALGLLTFDKNSGVSAELTALLFALGPAAGLAGGYLQRRSGRRQVAEALAT